jgi:hypothetical protein
MQKSDRRARNILPLNGMRSDSIRSTRIPLWVRFDFWRRRSSWGMASSVGFGSFFLTKLTNLALEPFSPSLLSEGPFPESLEGFGGDAIYILPCLFFAATALVFHPKLSDFLKIKILERIAQASHRGRKQGTKRRKALKIRACSSGD